MRGSKTRKPRRALQAKARPRSASRRSLKKPRRPARRQIAADLIARAGQELATSLDYQTTLVNVTNLIVPAIADDCFILLKTENGLPALVAGAHTESARGEVLRTVIGSLNPELNPRMPFFAVMKTGAPMLIHDPEMELKSAPRPDEALLRFVLKLGIRSRIVVPLKARGEIIGVMSWLSSSKHRYTADDLKTAEEIALRAAYAIDNARLHEAEKLATQRLTDLLNGLRASVWEALWNEQGNVNEVTFVNEAAEGLLGYPTTQLKDETASRLILVGADYDHVMGSYSRGIRSGRDFEVQYRARHGDGRVLWLRDVVRVSRAANGRPMVRVVTTDISRLKQVEQRLQVLAEAGRTLDSSLDHETTLSNVTALIVPALADDCIIFLANESGKLEMAASAHSDPAREGVAREFFRHYPLIERPEQPLQTVVRTGESVLIPDTMNISDAGAMMSRDQYEVSTGSQAHAAIAVPLRSRGTILGVMVWVAVESGRHYGQDDLRLAEEIANRAGIAVDNARLFKVSQDGVAARDRFLAMLGHELRNPLNSISIVARMLQRESLDAERLTKLRAMIARETRQLSTLVDDLLDVSRVLAGKMSLALQSIDLTALVRESAQSFEDMARQRELKFELSLPDEPVSIVGDPVRMHQVIANLVTNAIKFTEAPGSVEVRVRPEVDCAMLSVRDTGIGIAPEMLGRVFEPFAQANLRPPHGLGLGLSLVKEVTELHGGTVTATSEGIGRGAEFTVRLPRAALH
ncbi:MAG TPA: ATP-binding protein [Candidatus Binataceae bacterium]|nr:ATP-binding protein [Candidatus Binataceae bacterium]